MSYYHRYNYYYYTSVKSFKANPQLYVETEVTNMCKRQKLSKKFMREMKDHLDWTAISEYQQLDEAFLDEMKDYIKWDTLCKNNHKVVLSKEFIESHSDIVNWEGISAYGHLDEEFIFKHIDKLDINRIFNNYKAGHTHTLNVLTEFLRQKPEQQFNCWWAIKDDDITFDWLREWKDKIKFSAFIGIMSHKNKLEQFLDEFGKYFTESDWDSVEQYVGRLSFNCIMKYVDKWRFAPYRNPVYSLRNEYTEEEKEILKTLWRLHN